MYHYNGQSPKKNIGHTDFVRDAKNKKKFFGDFAIDVYIVWVRDPVGISQYRKKNNSFRCARHFVQ
jgi:hypothetical protein